MYRLTYKQLDIHVDQNVHDSAMKQEQNTVEYLVLLFLILMDHHKIVLVPFLKIIRLSAVQVFHI